MSLCSSLFPVSDRWMASWRQCCGMRLLPGTRKPRRTRPCPCPQLANQRIWTPSSWCHWSRRLSRPSWRASTTWPSLRAERAKSTPWWPQPIVWTTCAAWTLPGTPGSEKAAVIWRRAGVARKMLCSVRSLCCPSYLWSRLESPVRTHQCFTKTPLYLFLADGDCVSRFSSSWVSTNTCSYYYYYGLFTPFFVLKRFSL